MKKERTEVRELYTGLAILLWAVLGLENIPETMHRILLCSAIPMLITSTGLLVAERGDDFSVKKAAGRLLIPYAWFSLLLTAVFAAGTLLPFSPGLSGTEAGAQIRDRIAAALTFYGTGSLWLFPAIFIAVILRWGIGRFVKPVGTAVLICVPALTYVILHAVQGFYLTGMLNEPGIRGILVHLICVLWRGILAGPFLLWGMHLLPFAVALRKKRIGSIAIGAGMLCAGLILGGFSNGYNAERLLMGRPLLSLPAAFLISGGIYLLCDWIGQIRPVNICGRYAVILYIALTEFGILKAGEKLGQSVFRLFDHNFATKVTVILTVTLLSAISVLILKHPALSFLFGGELTPDGEGRNDTGKNG